MLLFCGRGRAPDSRASDPDLPALRTVRLVLDTNSHRTCCAWCLRAQTLHGLDALTVHHVEDHGLALPDQRLRRAHVGCYES
jgi:hypothetical protein